MHPEAIYAERALRAGARGYLAKQQLGEAVLAAIRRVLAGRIYMSEALGMELASRFRRRRRETPSRRSRRSATASCRCSG